MPEPQAILSWRTWDMRERGIILAGLAILSLFLVTIWVFKYPPLLDYPNHLARIHIFENLSDPNFQPYFGFEIGVPTNLALDAFTYLFALVLPVDIAGRLFVSLVVGLSVFAPLFLSKVVHGKVTAIALLFSVFLFNDALLMGFLNFLFGTALAIIGFGIHILMDKRDSRAWKRVLVGSVIATFVFVSHVYGFAVYAICIGGYYLVQFGLRDFKNLALNALQFIPVSALLAMFVAQSMTTDITQPVNVDLPNSGIVSEIQDTPLTTLDIEGVAAVDQPMEIAAWEYYVPFDIWVAWKKMSRLWIQYGDYAGLPLLFCVLLIGFYIWKRTWPTTLALFAPLAILIGFAVFLPPRLWGAENVHWRFFVPAAMFAAAILSAPRLERVSQAILIAGIVGLSSLQAGLVYGHFKRADSHQQMVVHLFQELPEGAKVLSLTPSGESRHIEHPIPITHMATLGVIENESFVPSLFAYSIQQPLRYRPPYDAMAKMPFYKNLEGVDWREVAAFYDYVLIMDHDGDIGGAASDWLQRIPIAHDPMSPASPHIALTRVSR